jgi:maltooligosyltrehalose trehalohydrolase
MTTDLKEMQKTQGESKLWEMTLGALPLADGSTIFRVWAPGVERLSVKILSETPRVIELRKGESDVFEAKVANVGEGFDYSYIFDDGRERPDPYSRWQPSGVHGPSRIVSPTAFQWSDDDWRGIPQKDLIIYELHTGTFTSEGIFESIIPELGFLKQLGIMAVELMPVAEFPGGRNWGYDGVDLYAPQSTYGGPLGLKRLVDACHAEGLAVILDVVYNHLGPEGNYLAEFFPLFSHNYKNPWGDAINFDGPESDGVRRFFADNALYWLTEFHFDGLRLDAIDRIIDTSPRHILQQIAGEFHRQAELLNRQAWLIAESDLNDVRIIKPPSEGGYGIDAQWNDDFHHSLHGVLTKTARGYFADFGRLEDLAKAITNGFVYDGQRSLFRRRSHGTMSVDRPAEQFVVCIQNHDQIANAYWGDRLSTVASMDQQKLAAALLILAPSLPLLFMGQEWGERAPFLYFTSHTDPDLAIAVREGRRAEYSSFVKEELESGDTVTEVFNDPQSPGTFLKSKLRWDEIGEPEHQGVLNLYRDLIRLRKTVPALSNCDRKGVAVTFDDNDRWLILTRTDRGGSEAMLCCNLSDDHNVVQVPAMKANAAAASSWRRVLWTGDEKYAGDSSRDRPPEALKGSKGDSLRLGPWEAVLYVNDDQVEM